MPTLIAATQDNTTDNAHKTCAHAYGASPTSIWLYKAKSEPETALNCLRTAELGRGVGDLSSGGGCPYLDVDKSCRLARACESCGAL